jgi:hypothetical protein
VELKIYDVRSKLSLEVINGDIKPTHKYEFQDFVHISSLIIPFSIFFGKKTSLDIYSGKELIPFEERDPIFKELFKNEFDCSLKEIK